MFKRRLKLARKVRTSNFGKKLRSFLIGKRQRFVASVIFLSTALFISEYFLGRSGMFLVFGLAILTDFLLYLSVKGDLKDNFSPQVFILPFLYSLAIGLFYLLVPARLLTRITITSLYALGLYSLYLSENIFIVSSMRTIALLSSARTVTFTISLLSYFFLSNVIFSLHLNVFLTLFFIFCFTFPMILQALWIYTLEKSIKTNFNWALFLTISIFELSILLWFWPSTPTLIALFLTGVFYSIVGLSQVWLEKRLFKGVIWEYILVSLIVFSVLFFYTSWS
ncbi:MAG: hypothetical protein A2W22_02105 [Candidatus Levybacteria bacterium RBG_16_35_11]|nr:MAG: hypothetical protein A2W22_02105 [Candidatus Levybacteria bacterium RBG_16_35_11]